MAKDKKSFVLYSDLIVSLEHLTFEEKGILFHHMLEYVNDKNPVLEDRLLLTAWKPIEAQLKRDLKKFEEVKAKRSEAGKRSAELRALKNDEQNSTNSTSVESVQQCSTNSTVNDNDNVNVNENVNDNVILLEKETKEENLSKENPHEIFPESESVETGAEERKKVAQKKERFKPPTVQEVQDYCNERQNGIQAYTFVNFYQSKGWKVGNQPMKDWRAAVRTWEQKNKQNGITNTTNAGFSNNATVSNGKVSGRSIVADRISQHLARNSESGNHTIDIEANIVR